MKTRNHIIYAMGLSALSLASCEKYLTVDQPKTLLSAREVFASDATANAAMSAAYTRSASLINGASGSVTYLGAHIADESDNYATTNAIQQLYAGQLIATNTFSSGLWTSGYSAIYHCNSVLEGITDNTSLSPTLVKQLKGEALFLRALLHLSLSSFYGDIPVITSTDYRLNTAASQRTQQRVYVAVTSDLELAKTLLPETYVPYASERIKPTKWAAASLLARAYLYSGDHQKAIQQSGEIIANTSLYSLTAPSDAFLKNSKEQILQYRPTSTTVNTNEGNFFILTGKPTQLAMSASFANGFETSDQRRTQWVSKVTVSGVDYFFPYKYKVRTGTVLTEYSSILRLAEQYLIRSEANARADQLPQAIADLDAVRVRAGLSKISMTNPSISKADLLEAILKERRSELFTEWAHRWIDLRRFGKVATVMAANKSTWQPSNSLFPIPDYDMRVNKNLKQNPGYQ